MRMLLATVGTAGDIHPFLALGQGLAARGHEVAVVTSPAHAARVAAAGLALVPVGTEAEYAEALADPVSWHPLRGPRKVLGLVADRLDEGVAAVRAAVAPGRTVLVASSLAWSARLVAEADGVPLATVHLAPGVFLSADRPPRLAGVPLPRWAPRWWARLVFRGADLAFGRLLGGRLDDARRRLGLAPVRRLLTAWWHHGDVVLALFPEWFAAPRPDWPPHLVQPGFVRWSAGGALDPELDRWLAAGPPPVVVTPGSGNLHARGMVAAALDGAARAGRRALVLTVDPGNLSGPLPPGSLHRRWAPLEAVLGRSAAVVHHGGIGTCAEGLAAGVPQVVLSFAFDQPDNGARLEALGCGVELPARRARPAAVARRLRELLGDPATAARCRRAAERIAATDAVGAACDAIEALGRRRRTGATAPPRA